MLLVLSCGGDRVGARASSPAELPPGDSPRGARCPLSVAAALAPVRTRQIRVFRVGARLRFTCTVFGVSSVLSSVGGRKAKRRQSSRQRLSVRLPRSPKATYSTGAPISASLHVASMYLRTSCSSSALSSTTTSSIVVGWNSQVAPRSREDVSPFWNLRPLIP